MANDLCSNASFALGWLENNQMKVKIKEEAVNEIRERNQNRVSFRITTIEFDIRTHKENDEFLYYRKWRG